MDPNDVIVHPLAPLGNVANNPHCPLLVYPAALPAAGHDLAARFEDLFDANGWPARWRSGVFPFQHFHSSAHEVLGVYSGEASVQFGGEGGLCVEVAPGDVVVVPAGVAHRKTAQRGSLGVVGGYPRGHSADLLRPGDMALAQLVRAVSDVPVPVSDPVFGVDGPLCRCWRAP